MRFLLALLLLFTVDAQAAKLLSKRAPVYFPSFGVGSTSSVAYTGTAGASFRWYATGGGDTTLLRVMTTSAAYIATGLNPTATASDLYLPANTELILEVISGYKVSAVPVSSNGTLYSTELITYPQLD